MPAELRGGLVAMLITVAVLTWGCDSQDRRESEPKAEEQLQADGELLQTLGYVQWSEELDERSQSLSSVVRLDPSKSQPGLNLYALSSPEDGWGAYLFDAFGEVVHRWSTRTSAGWAVARLLPGGDLLVIQEAKALLRLDWDSDVIWRRNLHAHHDLALDASDNIYLLTDGAPIEAKNGPGAYPIRRQGVSVVSPSGDLLRSFSFNSLFPEAVPELTAEAIQAYVRAEPTRLKNRRTGGVLDTLHSNSITILSRDVPGLGHTGGILLSMRRTDTIALLDAKAQRVEWRWGPGEILRQHHPNLLDNGCLLIFDNGNGSRPWSRIVEFCPREDRVVWEYRGTEQEPFFSDSRGSVQLLENDNVLITDSNSGRVFEVTRGGEIVWEWFNPRTRDRKGAVRRRPVYRMTRISGDLLASLPLNHQLEH